jgi:hypothetical protein
MQPLEATQPLAPRILEQELQVIPLKPFAQEQKWTLAF